MTRKLNEIRRNAVCAWYPGHSVPLLATGTLANSFDHHPSQLEIVSIESVSTSKKVTTTSRFHALAWGHITQEKPFGLIAGGMETGQLELWDASSLLYSSEDALVLRHSAHAGTLQALDFNTLQTHLLASAGSQSEVYIWDLEHPSTPFTPGARSSKMDHIVSVAWNCQVQHIVSTASTNGYTVVWDLRNKREVMTLVGQQQNSISSIAWHPDVATQIATASDDDHSPVITLWDLRYAHTPQRTLRGHTQGVLDLSWCRQDADRLFSSGKDGNTLCWNPNTGELQGTIATETQPTFQVAWSCAHPDLLATSSLDGSVYVYSLFQPSSWLRRPIGASFGSNGTLVTFNATKKTVQLKAMTAHSDIIQRSQQLVSATEEQLASLIKKRIQQGQDQQDWQVLDILLSHHAREAMIHYLGFQKEQIAAKATHLLTTKDVDTLITQAIMLGDFESAVDACLASKRFSDAFAIASCSSNALLDRTRKAYFEANQVGYMCLLESIAHDDLVSMVHQADLSQWSCILATLCTFASAQEFGALCDQMGQRLSDHAELCSHATLFYLVSGNLPKLVQAWTQTIDRHNPSSLQSVIEKITVFQKAIDFKDRGEKDAEGRYVLADLYDLYQDYAAWMTAQGQSDIALTYQQLIPSLGEKTSAVAPTTPAKKTSVLPSSSTAAYFSAYQ
ncbi:WD40-repeat-containing domain protein [Gilbertella persicaria]|uniref:WD40-repeat-containing domain protein n=1 Tax=Gilbertella persicaria TaxID=101096 RepID=UPI00221E5C49|nr:WD40-repeat-containing domain protein [Gilbertella persicaria]KAI8087927.1 WD40-repeat-containing domain protein [Gilbertella persicaria]